MIDISTREASAKTLLKIGKIYDNFVVLDADLSVSTMTNEFAKEYPDKFFDIGCAEQNLIGIASGLAIGGNIVFTNSYSMFIMRAWEQIRNTVAHDNLNVKIIATHAGLTNSADGSSHQCLEDIAIMRCIPNMAVLNPVDSIETEQMLINEIHRRGAAFIRLNRIGTMKINDDDYKFEFGKIVKVREGTDIAIITTGTMVANAIKASERLKNENISACVLNVHTIKPLDKNTIIKVAKDTGRIITVEEHNIYGGLGGAVAEILSENYPVPMKIMGINDRFGESGEYEHLIKKFGLSIDDIVKNSRNLIYH